MNHSPSNAPALDPIIARVRATGRFESIAVGSAVLGPPAALIIAIGFLPASARAWPQLTVCAAMSMVTFAGLALGYRRIFSLQRGCNIPFARWCLGLLGGMAAEGALFHWASEYRRSRLLRRRSPSRRRPSVTMSGFLRVWRNWARAVFASIFPQPSDPDFACIGRLACDPVAAAIDRHYLTALAAGLLLPGLLTMALAGSTNAYWSGVVWGGIIRIMLVRHAWWSACALRALKRSRRVHRAPVFAWRRLPQAKVEPAAMSLDRASTG